MVIPKIELILEAYTKLRISGLTTDASPEEIVLALRRMAGVFAALPWNVGYIYPSTIGGDDPNDDSGITADIFDPLTTILAFKIMGDFGKNSISQTEYMNAEDTLARKFSEIEGAKYQEILPVGGANQYPGGLRRYFYDGNRPSENDDGGYH